MYDLEVPKSYHYNLFTRTDIVTVILYFHDLAEGLVKLEQFYGDWVFLDM